MAESSPEKWENTVGKGEIARFEQFLLFPHRFQELYCIQGFVWERVKGLIKDKKYEHRKKGGKEFSKKN